MQLTESIKSLAHELRFDWVGVAPAVQPAGWGPLQDWLAHNYHGEMHYIANRRDAYRHPSSVHPPVRHLVILGQHYAGPLANAESSEKPTSSPPLAVATHRIASYATVAGDYHDLLRAKLQQLGTYLETWVPDVQWRGVVDTAPLLEREFASLAGIGWQGKNTMLISPRAGSYFLLAALLVDCELVNDQPLAVDHCGSCRRCLDACPTQAFVAERVLDASKCISYLTIELKTQIPLELREGIGDWWFGCDVYQEVCPWNRFAPAPQDPDFQSHLDDFPTDLAQLFFWEEAEFRRVLRHTPLWRAKRRGLLRNAAIVLGNQARESTLPALARALQDQEPLVRGAAAWALQKFPSAEVATLLRTRRTAETDADVVQEIEQSLTALNLTS